MRCPDCGGPVKNGVCQNCGWTANGGGEQMPSDVPRRASDVPPPPKKKRPAKKSSSSRY
jgi:hypothetical protein